MRRELVIVADGILRYQRSDGPVRYYVDVRKHGRRYRIAGHCKTYEEARSTRDTLAAQIPDVEPFDDDSAAGYVRTHETLMSVLKRVIKSGDAAPLGPVASLLLVALQRSRLAANDPLNFDRILHPPASWPSFDTTLCRLFMTAFVKHTNKERKQWNQKQDQETQQEQYTAPSQK